VATTKRARKAERWRALDNNVQISTLPYDGFAQGRVSGGLFEQTALVTVAD